jgi:hypothetical protein
VQTPAPDPARRIFTAPVDPIGTGYIPNDLDALQEIATHYHGEKGDFAYTAFRWVNRTLFGDQLPTTLIQWGLLPYGKCIGQTRSQDDRYPVVTLHPGIWQDGPRRTLDTILHESIHVAMWYLRGLEKGHSSHDNPTWASECVRLAPLVGLGPIQAAPTKRIMKDGKYTRATPAGCISMDALSKFPYSLRPTGYFQGPSLPWD